MTEAHYLVVAQSALASKEHLGMVVQPEGRFTMSADMSFQALVYHLSCRFGSVEQTECYGGRYQCGNVSKLK